jgi:hypothetical protein
MTAIWNQPKTILQGYPMQRDWQLYLDCDGVLANFDKAAVAAFGVPAREYEVINGWDTFWEKIRSVQPNVYAELELLPDAMELYNAVKHLRPIILTGSSREWARPQKLAWRDKYFPGVPMIVCRSNEKCRNCQPGDVLIDDYLKYQQLWIDAGGIFIYHTSAFTSINRLSFIKGL